mmetsp:Transcript_107635/g.273294  ORF Transcript_107635/g.273294 Transcript_107635/m.273294 type:complete len:238 (+) Transcript_107635:818-1531(+)
MRAAEAAGLGELGVGDGQLLTLLHSRPRAHDEVPAVEALRAIGLLAVVEGRGMEVQTEANLPELLVRNANGVHGDDRQQPRRPQCIRRVHRPLAEASAHHACAQFAHAHELASSGLAQRVPMVLEAQPWDGAISALVADAPPHRPRGQPQGRGQVRKSAPGRHRLAGPHLARQILGLCLLPVLRRHKAQPRGRAAQQLRAAAVAVGRGERPVATLTELSDGEHRRPRLLAQSDLTAL